MKKNYTFVLLFILLVAGVNSQNLETQIPYEKYDGIFSKIKKNQNQKLSSNSFNGWIDPTGSILETKGIAAADYAKYAVPVFMDSTVRMSFPGILSYVPVCAMGAVFDPKSSLLTPDVTPLISADEVYYIDSLNIPGYYKRVSNSAVTDTLYTYITWTTPTPTNTPISITKSYSTIYTNPADAMNSWSGALMAFRVVNAPTLTGNRMRAAAPSTNMLRIKTLLTASSPTFGIDVPFPETLTVPANHIVAAYYTFVPGTTHTLGEVFYASSTSTVTPTQNGFAGLSYKQTKTINSSKDFSDMFSCPDAVNHGLVYYKEDRHAKSPNGVSGLIRQDVKDNPIIYFHTFNSPTSIRELNHYNFSLTQNSPNPFSKHSLIHYNLINQAKSAFFTVTDVTGRVIYSDQVDNSVGTHSISLGAYASGLYYYSLNVDGYVITKKMIVE